MYFGPKRFFMDTIFTQFLSVSSEVVYAAHTNNCRRFPFCHCGESGCRDPNMSRMNQKKPAEAGFLESITALFRPE
jgi:hypothetical protein